VSEDDRVVSREDEVGNPGKPSIMKAESETARMEPPPDEKLGLRVPRTTSGVTMSAIGSRQMERQLWLPPRVAARHTFDVGRHVAGYVLDHRHHGRVS